jgi:hypothetical protein
MVQDHFAATSSHDSDPLPSTKVTPELLDDHTKATTWTQRNMLRGVAVIAGLVFLTIAVNHLRGTSWQQSSISLNHQFWIEVFAPDRDTIVVSADSGLGILENLSHKRVSLGDYVAGTYLTQPDKSENIDQRNWNDLRTQQYTSMADMNIAVSLSKQPEHISGRLAIRSARDIRMDEIKHANVILLGSVHTNPWVELFQQRMNFVLEYGPEVDDSVVTNRDPSAGEDAAYKNAWAENSSNVRGTRLRPEYG